MLYGNVEIYIGKFSDYQLIDTLEVLISGNNKFVYNVTPTDKGQHEVTGLIAHDPTKRDTTTANGIKFTCHFYVE